MKVAGMTPSNQPRWYSLSLRTLLIAVTLLGVVFARIPSRQLAIAKRDRLQKLQVSTSYAYSVEFSNSIAGWDLPEPTYTNLKGGGQRKQNDVWWLRPLSAPVLRSLDLSNEHDEPPPVWIAEALAGDGLREISLTTHNPATLKLVGRFRREVQTLRVTQAGPGLLKPLGTSIHVKHLFFDWTEITDEFLEELVQQFPSLETLEFDSDNSLFATPDGIAALRRLPLLTRLRLDVDGLVPAHITEIAKLQQLRDLSLADYKLEAAAFPPLKQLRNLRMLNLPYDEEEEEDEHFRKIRGDWRPPAEPCGQIIPIVG